MPSEIIPAIDDALAETPITDAAITDARAMIGTILRPEGPYLQDATVDTIRNFCNGIGDLNPLYRDVEYGRSTKYASVVAHPMFPYAFGWPGRTRWGFPGVHGFYAGNDWEFFRTVRPGDRIACIERVVGVAVKEGRFSGRFAIQYVEATYTNQRDEVVARVLGWCTRHPRAASRASGKYSDLKKYEYSAAELESIVAEGLAEAAKVRGGAVRYWEDVDVGEELTPIVRGPLSLMDTMGFLVGCGRGHTHGILLGNAVRHPGHYFRNPEAGAGIEYSGIGHHRDSVAQSVGVPGTYDYGPQRTAWMCTLVTNWMGDAAFLKRLRADMRRFNIVGDTTWCKGKISAKYVKDGYSLIDIDIWAENQRGETTSPGVASVILPSRDPQLLPVVDGRSLDLELPQIR
jgi:acyl dehydratase